MASFQELMDEARSLITYSPVLDEDKKKPKSKEVMDKNKRGFEKLKMAVTMKECDWMTQFNIAEFYYNALDGATPVDETKAVYHYFCAWTLYGNDTIMAETQSSPFTEPILINFAALVPHIKMKESEDANDVNNGYVLNIDEVIGFCQALQQKGKYISSTLLSHYIHGRVLIHLLHDTMGGLGHYKLCIELRNHYKAKVSGQVAIAIRNAEKEMNEIQPASDDGKEMNDGNGDGMKKCAFCGKLLQRPKHCGRCKLVYYCSIECQRPHWKKHKKTCKKLIK